LLPSARELFHTCKLVCIQCVTRCSYASDETCLHVPIAFQFLPAQVFGFIGRMRSRQRMWTLAQVRHERTCRHMHVTNKKTGGCFSAALVIRTPQANTSVSPILDSVPRLSEQGLNDMHVEILAGVAETAQEGTFPEPEQG
jgi:hypothetical protein